MTEPVKRNTPVNFLEMLQEEKAIVKSDSFALPDHGLSSYLLLDGTLIFDEGEFYQAQRNGNLIPEIAAMDAELNKLGFYSPSEMFAMARISEGEGPDEFMFLMLRRDGSMHPNDLGWIAGKYWQYFPSRIIGFDYMLDYGKAICIRVRKEHHHLWTPEFVAELALVFGESDLPDSPARIVIEPV